MRRSTIGLVGLALLMSIAAAIASADKPLVIESGQVKQLPANTTLQTQAASTANASINMPHGTAPTSPVNGDCWTTSAGLYCRINGSTVGPYGTGTGGGSVTSVAMTGDGTVYNVSVTGSPITTSGTLAPSLHTQSANQVLAGPTTGAAAAPTFRALVAADLPLFSSTLNGAVSASGGGTTNFLRADGTWAAPAGGSGTVTTTGSPASGNLTKFSGATSITNGDLSGDVTTSGTLATVVGKVNGVSYGTSPSTNTVPVVTGTNATTYEAVPNAALANSMMTIGGQSISLGGSTTNQGNGSKLQLSTGSTTTNDCAKYDANGNVVDGGTICSGGGGGTGAWWNFTIPLSTTETHSFATSGNLFKPQLNITIYEASALLTTVTSATYKIGIAPYNTSTNQITSLPTYTGVFTAGTGAASQWVRGFFTGGVALTAGTTYVIFVVRTDSTTTVSTTLNTDTPALGVASPGIFEATTSRSVHLASTAPQTTDTWTTEGGFFIIWHTYQFT